MKKILISVVFLLFVTAISNAQEIRYTIYFAEGEFDVSDEKAEEIKSLFYNSNGEDFNVTLTGYTDNKGTIKSNKYLSRLRAERVRTFLQKICVKLEKVTPIGAGEVDPYDGPKEKKNDAHRRVELVATYKETTNKNKLIKNREACLRGEYSFENTNVVKFVAPEPEPYVSNVTQNAVSGLQVEKPKEKKIFDEKIPEFKELNTGDKLVFRGINFHRGSDRFLKNSYVILDQLLDMMLSNPSINIKITGHVCCGVPKDEREKKEVDKLSDDRARAVYNYLVDNKVYPNRMAYEGKGFNEPLVADEKNAADQERNRRVEVEITKK